VSKADLIEVLRRRHEAKAEGEGGSESKIKATARVRRKGLSAQCYWRHDGMLARAIIGGNVLIDNELSRAVYAGLRRR